MIVLSAFLFTAVFFIEYLPLFPRVFIPFDLDSFHFPLADYAFQVIRAGRFPLWDPTIYCGLSFAGNPQAALFYPPTWLMFLLSLRHPALPYWALEDLVLGHVCLAFVLCYSWLHRARKLHWLASILGSGVFAFSGYPLLHLQHLGLICGYAWMPLGFAAIDETAELPLRSWQGLWKLVLAFAMCIVAGYPPLWVVFAVCMLAYACGRRDGLRLAGLVTLALAASVLLTAVQLLPAWEASRVKAPDIKYAAISGVRDPQIYVSYFLPNYFNFSLNVDPTTDPQGQYLYLGAAGLAGLALLVIRRRFQKAGAPTVLLLAALAFVINPFGLLGSIIGRSLWLAQIFAAWYFLAGVSAAIACLAATGLDCGLTRVDRKVPVWVASATIVLALAWSARLVFVWARGASAFATGWRSALDTCAAVALFAILARTFANSAERVRTIAAVSLLILAAAEYKAFGTSRWFDAARVKIPATARALPSVAGMSLQNYESLRRQPEFRVALDVTGLFPVLLRHSGLTTPQGFDPLLPAQYQALIDPIWRFRTNREFDITPEKEDALRLLGVGHFVTAERAPLYLQLASNPHFRLLPPEDGYYKVFELIDAQPAAGWEAERVHGTTGIVKWEPERRTFRVQSADGGDFRLAEQFFPGWTATLDGAPTQIVRCHQAFQCVTVPAGEHVVEFQYGSPTLFPGAVVSLLSLLGIVILTRYPANHALHR
jgi:hypothetical protein